MKNNAGPKYNSITVVVTIIYLVFHIINIRKSFSRIIVLFNVKKITCTILKNDQNCLTKRNETFHRLSRHLAKLHALTLTGL